MTARPGGLVPGIGWVALASDVPDGTLIANTPSGLPGDATTAGAWSKGCRVPMVVVAWPDGSTPASPEGGKA